MKRKQSYSVFYMSMVLVVPKQSGTLGLTVQIRTTLLQGQASPRFVSQSDNSKCAAVGESYRITSTMGGGPEGGSKYGRYFEDILVCEKNYRVRR